MASTRNTIAGLWIAIWFIIGCVFLLSALAQTGSVGASNEPQVGVDTHIVITGGIGIFCWFVACWGSVIGEGSESSGVEYVPVTRTEYHSSRSTYMGKSDCSECNGNGRCNRCGGSGKAGGPMRARRLNNDHEYNTHDCMVCGGTGTCMKCQGKGEY